MRSDLGGTVWDKKVPYGHGVHTPKHLGVQIPAQKGNFHPYNTNFQQHPYHGITFE
jgi:hypothetical protein